jgi:hypothetical protein
MVADSRAQHLINSYQKLKGVRGNWEQQWQDVADYVIPRKNDINTKRFPGELRNLKVYDGSAQHANELLASALHSMLTNPSLFWFELTTGDDDLDEQDDVARWLEDTSRIMHNVINSSNFQTEIHEVYLDLGSFGTSILLIEDDKDHFVRFSAKYVGNSYIQESNKGLVNEIYNVFEWTLQQAVDEWGDKVGRNVLERVKKSPTDKIQILQAVLPRRDGFSTSKLPFNEFYINLDEGNIIEESGFKEFPYVVSRWLKSTGEMYGRSPATKALPFIKMINEVSRTTIRGAQKTVDPPLMVPDDGFIGPTGTGVRTRPGGLNYYRAGSTDRIEPLVTNARVDFGFQYIDRLSTEIRSAFFIDQLQLQDGPQMTATEVLQRTQENLRVLGPVLGRQHHELLRPMVSRIFNMLLRRKVIDPRKIPPVLSERNIDVQYTSLIAKAQKASEAQAIIQTLTDVAPFMEQDPTIADNINGDEAFRFIANLRGFPRQIMRDRDEVETVRNGRADAQEEAIEQDQVNQGVDNVSKLAPLLGQA